MNSGVVPPIPAPGCRPVPEEPVFPALRWRSGVVAPYVRVLVSLIAAPWESAVGSGHRCAIPRGLVTRLLRCGGARECSLPRPRLAPARGDSEARIGLLEILGFDPEFTQRHQRRKAALASGPQAGPEGKIKQIHCAARRIREVATLRADEPIPAEMSSNLELRRSRRCPFCSRSSDTPTAGWATSGGPLASAPRWRS